MRNIMSFVQGECDSAEHGQEFGVIFHIWAMHMENLLSVDVSLL